VLPEWSLGVAEVGSGLHGRRRELRRVLSDPAATVIVVEHRDRLARCGAEDLESVLVASGRRRVVGGLRETAGGLVGDVTEVLAWMCAGLCGRWAGQSRAAAAVATAVGGVG
jgi:putative resolvase